MSNKVRYSSTPTREDRCAAVVMDTFTREYVFYRQCRNRPEKGTRVCKTHFLTYTTIPYYRPDQYGEPDDNVEDHLGQDALLRLRGQMGNLYKDPSVPLRTQIRALSRELDNSRHQISGLNEKLQDQEKSIRLLARNRDVALREVEEHLASKELYEQQLAQCIGEDRELRMARSSLERCKQEVDEKTEALYAVQTELEQTQKNQRRFLENAAGLEEEYNRVASQLEKCNSLLPEDEYY